MPNLIINDYCNLTCSYCFAKKTKSEMSLEMFKEILYGLSIKENYSVGIIGGEPTLHSNFKEILDFCKEPEFNNFHFTIFTNGIEFYDYVSYIDNNIGCLININNPVNMLADQIIKLEKTLEGLKDKKNYSVGCNLYPDCDDYSFFFGLAKYSKQPYRCSVVAPTSEYDKTHMKEYYEKMKPIFLNFVKQAKEFNKTIRMDCNRIPRCYFSKEELVLINEVVENYDNWLCAPVRDITSNLEIKDCFGRGNTTQFKTLQDLINDLIDYPITYPKNHKPECADCGWNHTCQGGCLAFKS